MNTCFRAGWFAHGADARMGERAAYEGKFAHAGQADIGDELAAPAQQAVVLLAWHAQPMP